MTKEERLEQIRDKFLDFDSDDIEKEDMYIIGFVKKISNADKEALLKNADCWSDYGAELLGFFDAQDTTYAVFVPRGEHYDIEQADIFTICMRGAWDDKFGGKFKGANNQELKVNYGFG